MSLSTHSEDLLLNWLLNTETATRPTAWHIALHDGAPGETGANEVTTSEDADYTRQSTTFDAASGGISQNAAAVSWTVASGSAGYTVTHASIWDAATSGNCLFIGELQAPRTLAADGVLTFEIGEIVAALD